MEQFLILFYLQGLLLELVEQFYAALLLQDEQVEIDENEESILSLHVSSLITLLLILAFHIGISFRVYMSTLHSQDSSTYLLPCIHFIT